MTGLEIRKLTLDDKAQVDELLCKAFAGINPGGIVEREVALAPDTSWVATNDGSMAGLLCAIQYQGIAYVGPMGVAPEFQGKGIGRGLFQLMVDELEQRGCSTMLLDATEAGEPLYRKFGFEVTTRTFDMTRELPGGGVNPLPAVREFERTRRMDAEWFGADRRPMLERLLEVEGAAHFANEQGYLISQTKVLGPFAASTLQSATELLDHALAAGAVASRVLAPIENPDARRLLESRGFHVQREVKHMRRGRPIGMRRDLMYGLASFALG
jgi:predicted N-acetyltransferase YhbS